MVESRIFVPTATSVRQARIFAAEQAARLTTSQASDLVLLVSELATNAVSHARSEFEVTIDVNENEVGVRVTDTGPGTPVLLSPTTDDMWGRGLLVVEKLSTDWGVLFTDDGTGKTVWFSMSLA